MIATGVSSRGWDIKGVNHIINYDLPSSTYGGIQEYVHRIGRTARIGHQGLATSFYNDRNEDVAQALVNVLLECGCEVPDFLSQFKPEDESKIEFDDDSGEEDASEGGFAGEMIAEEGAGGFAAPGWGAAAAGDKCAAKTGFQPDAGAAGASAW